MILDVKKLLGSKEGAAQDRFETELAQMDFPTGFALESPVQVDWQARREGEQAAVHLSIVCPAVIICDRCLERVSREYRYELDYLFDERDWNTNEPEYPFDAFGRLDLEKLCYDELLLNLPSRLLCSEDCEGLCPVCGKPVKAGCGCRQNVGDDRLSILKQLLS
ncbi:MAG TPA: DUF177 domain-containing protein [Candidatus Pygmaiobacter gallistercoris]|nr:DUF177 domain-containing protein [Candidatus Pygmaiobacter gallistercoris]